MHCNVHCISSAKKIMLKHDTCTMTRQSVQLPQLTNNFLSNFFSNLLIHKWKKEYKEHKTVGQRYWCKKRDPRTTSYTWKSMNLTQGCGKLCFREKKFGMIDSLAWLRLVSLLPADESSLLVPRNWLPSVPLTRRPCCYTFATTQAFGTNSTRGERGHRATSTCSKTGGSSFSKIQSAQCVVGQL